MTTQADGAAEQPPAAADPDRAAAAEQLRLEAERAAIALLIPGNRLAAAQKAEAAEAERRALLPEPREALRAAHQARAQADVDHFREVVDRARRHLSETIEARNAAKRELEAVEAEHTAQLIEDLAGGSAGRVEPVAGEKRVALAEAEHQVEIASRAAEKLAGDLEAADQRRAAAGRAVAEAVIGMLLEEAGRQADEILHAADELDQRRAALDAIAMTITQQQRVSGAPRTGWPGQIREALAPELRGAPRLPSKFATPAGDALVQRYARIAKALGGDPEAEIEAAP